MPTALAPASWAICPTSDPTGPLAAATTTVSRGCGLPITRRPPYAVNPGIPSTPRPVVTGRSGRIELAKARAVRERVCPPSCSREDDVTFDICGIVRDEHMRHGFPGHHLADLEWLGIRLTVVHTATHVRVEGEVLHLEQKLPGCRGRDGGLLEAEIGEPRPPLWSSRENDLSPTCCHDATFSLSEMWARWTRPRPNEMFSPGVS